MPTEDASWVTQFEYYKTIREQWDISAVEMTSEERKDGTKLYTMRSDNIVIARVLTRSDDRVIQVLWPPLRLH